MIPNITQPSESEIIDSQPYKPAALAKDMILFLDSMKVEETKNKLSALAIALVAVAARAKRTFIIKHEEDGIERMILRWLSGMDSVTKLHFSNYIKLPNNDTTTD